ncbi:chondroitinase family polysaccharide lyase [Aestuariivivens insulae]|uniref:chondroitinase family polysaccharide lyase n=1 Tax=Aestuariivivens insulae TaxID=1621988 RepID=UPI001F578D57|nr:chondroitinase family polysaccharide lyase [Aestuariivivens insulae]
MTRKLQKYKTVRMLRNGLFCFVVFLVLDCTVQGQEYPAVESFEKEATIKAYKHSENSKLNISDSHFRFGKTSLQWEWNGESSWVETSNFRILSHDESPLAYGDHFPSSPTFTFSVYSETPQKGSVRFIFSKVGEEDVWFDLDLNFYGWRRLWVPFYEMQGNAPKKGAAVSYTNFKVQATAVSGTLYFDDIIFSQYQDDRHQYPDLQVPFIKDGGSGDDHWMPLISNYNHLRSLKVNPISVAIKLDLLRVEKALDNDLEIAKKYKVYINSLKEDYQSLKLNVNGKTVTGPPLTYQLKQEYFDKKQQGAKNYNDIADFGKKIKKLSNYYNRANPSEQQEIKTMFVAASKYFLDQGWQAGASGGTRHHIGYSVRDITEAFYKMRHALREEGLLSQIGVSLHWLHNLGMVLADEKEFHVNIDYLNTQSYYHLMLIFLMESQEEQAALLAAYSKYISITLAQQNEDWGFKVDGTSWHHNGHYPAYGIGAFKTVPKVISTLSGTRFRIRPQGHENFKRAFLTTRIYSQLYNWGFGNAGRHPLENNGIKDLKEQYLLMANAGNPKGTSNIDKDVAAAYLRLWGKDDMLNSTLFTKVNGIHKERLSGYYTLPYAATAIHRRNDWAAIMKGYSKYVWASEIYADENRYGRYPANGTIQLLNSGGEKGSGFQQEGWDWNRYPGATVIYLPFEELEPEMLLIMFRSNESFAGAVELDGNGAFGMVLNEDKGSNADGKEVNIGFPGKLKAKKSVFSFGDKLICIGTNISSIDPKNPTQTNLFQTALTDKKAPVYTSSGNLSKFPFETQLTQETNNWVVDPYGNGYHILSNSLVHVKKEEQHSYHNKYSLRTGGMNPKGKGAKETEGDYAAAWIDHGMAPENASYQYIIYPFMDEDDIKAFSNKVKNSDTYAILRADATAHIALDKETNTTGYVIFEANKTLGHGVLKEVSEPSLIMVNQEHPNMLQLSVVQPDLNFPEYKPGKFKNYSQPVQLTITLEGKWNVIDKEPTTTVDNSGDSTRITLECINGFSKKLKLGKL